MAVTPLIACSHCAAVYQRVIITPGAIASCPRCRGVLYRQSGVALNGWIALTLAALLVFLIANLTPIATLHLQGISLNATLPGALWLTWQQGNRLLSVMTGLAAFWFPLTQLLFLLWGFLSLRSGKLPNDFRYGMRFLHQLAYWSMIPVLMLGILVSIVKFSSIARLQIQPGLYAFAVLTVLLTILGRFSAHRLWRYAEDAGLVVVSGDGVNLHARVAACMSCGFVHNCQSKKSHCARCGATVQRRKPATHSRVWALILAASIIYIPANVLPVMELRTVAGGSAHTIVGGVIELWQMGSWDLAVIVFAASVVIPMTKLMALAVLQLLTDWRGYNVQRQRTRLFELVEFIGQWSMLDVFVVVLLTAMANFSGVSQIIAGPGALSFGIVVVLTMLAAFSYDSRKGWDNDPAISHIEK